MGRLADEKLSRELIVIIIAFIALMIILLLFFMTKLKPLLG